MDKKEFLEISALTVVPGARCRRWQKPGIASAGKKESADNFAPTVVQDGPRRKCLRLGTVPAAEKESAEIFAITAARREENSTGGKEQK